MPINNDLKLFSHETLTHCENLSAITLYGFQIQYWLFINEIPDYICIMARLTTSTNRQFVSYLAMNAYNYLRCVKSDPTLLPTLNTNYQAKFN